MSGRLHFRSYHLICRSSHFFFVFSSHKTKTPGSRKSSSRHGRSNHRRCLVRKDVLINFAKFTKKRLCQSLFFNEVADPRPPTLLKKRLCHSCFPVNLAKLLRTPFLQKTSWWLVVTLDLTPPKLSHQQSFHRLCKCHQESF